VNPPRKYKTAVAFRVALETRLQKFALDQHVDLQRVRREVAFDRLLCRLFANPDAPWLLKGGYAMELRIKAARTTRDIDLALKRLPRSEGGWEENLGDVLELLRDAGGKNLEDFFDFVIGEPIEDLEAAPYGGSRFPVNARLAGRSFVKFQLDISTGDILREPYEILRGHVWLGFAGIAAGNFPAISSEEQFAEKLHAYTLPQHGRENSRVKDLVDLVLLINQGRMNVGRLRADIRDTFARRKTHDVPEALSEPPSSWVKVFAELAAECRIGGSLYSEFEKVRDFVSAVLR
jgi:hypothetical protein